MHRFRYICILLFLLLPASSFSSGSDSILKKIIERQNRIKTIDCTISQFIYEKGEVIRYSGRYRADASGRFRIDYTNPSKQTVVNTAKVLYWHIPEDNNLYIIPSQRGGAKASQIGNTGELIKKIDDRHKITYTGFHFYGFFKIAHRFMMIDLEHGNRIEFITDAAHFTIIEKRMKDRDGNEIIREVYGDYTLIQEELFPGRVDVFAKTETGVTRSISKYSDISLNGPIPDGVFVLKVPKNVKKHIYGAP